jgi:prepilin-type N-terminal cleavage/methylation domain-containing protein
MRARSHSGFTLIELSIVLVIIGLLVGGVLVGRDLIKASELRQLNSRFVELETAIHTFRLKYGVALPGDWNNADSFFGGQSYCISTTVCNGNGDGYIMTPEHRKALLHLSLAGLIPGGTFDPAYTGVNFNVAHNPKATFMQTPYNNVGITFSYTTWTGFTAEGCVDGNDRRQGNYLMATLVDSTVTHVNEYHGHLMYGFMTIDVAKQFERKFDNGQARSGKVFAYGDTWNCSYSYNHCNASAGRPGWVSTADTSVPGCGLIYWLIN